MKNEDIEEKIIESENNNIISSIKGTIISKEEKEGETIKKEIIEIKEDNIPDTIEEDTKVVNEIRSANIKESEKDIEAKGKQCQKCNCFVF